LFHLSIFSDTPVRFQPTANSDLPPDNYPSDLTFHWRTFGSGTENLFLNQKIYHQENVMKKANNFYLDGPRKDVLPYQNIESGLADIIPDSVILDTGFTILDASTSVLRVLGYKKENLAGKKFSEIVSEGFNKIVSAIQQGYYVHSGVVINNAKGKRMKFQLSGYYLGLISEINGKIIISLKNLEETAENRKQSDRRFSIINQIIYRSSHDLRGPLCTVKGLLQLASMEKCSAEVKDYLDKASTCIDRLDLKLGHIRESINLNNPEFNHFTFSSLIGQFKSRMEKFAEICGLEISYQVNDPLPQQMFFTNLTYLTFFMQNLLIVVESVNESSQNEYQIEIYQDMDVIYFIIKNHNISLRMHEHFREIPGFRGIKHIVNTMGYNYLNLKMLKIFQDAIRAKVSFSPSAPSILRIEVPAIPHINLNK
jgi:hypothetical protein